MIIVISGSVGCGKTTIAEILGKKLKFEVVNLGEMAQDFKIEDVKELQTFDFDIDALLLSIEKKIKLFNKEKKNVIVESHFAHFIKPEYIDYLFIINRDLKELKKEYKIRKYNTVKIKDNLEVESFNLCFYEALENGYEEEDKVFCVNNDKDLNLIVSELCLKIKN